MKKLSFLSKPLVWCILCLTGSAVYGQGLQRSQPPARAEKPAVERVAPPMATPALGFDAKVGINSGVPNFTTIAEKEAYSQQRRKAAAQQQLGGAANNQQPIDEAKRKAANEQASANSKLFAQLKAYEAQHLAGVDVNTMAGRLRQLEVHKAFYVSQGDAATAAKVQAAIDAAKAGQ